MVGWSAWIVGVVVAATSLPRRAGRPTGCGAGSASLEPGGARGEAAANRLPAVRSTR